MIYNDEPDIRIAYAFREDNLTWIGQRLACVPSDVVIKYKNKRVGQYQSFQEIGFKEGNILYVSNDKTFSSNYRQIFFQTTYRKIITLDCQLRCTVADMKYLVQRS